MCDNETLVLRMLIGQVIFDNATPKEAAVAAAVCKQWRRALGPRVAAAVALRQDGEYGVHDGPCINLTSFLDGCRAMSSLVKAGKRAMAPHAEIIAQLCANPRLVGEARARSTRCLELMKDVAAPHAGTIIFSLLDSKRSHARQSLPEVVVALGTHALPHLPELARRLSHCRGGGGGAGAGGSGGAGGTGGTGAGADDGEEEDELRRYQREHDDREVREAVLEVLERVRPRWPRAVSKIINLVGDMLDHASADVRVAALAALYIADELAKSKLDAVVACLRDEDTHVIVAATRVLRVMAGHARRYARRVAAMLDDGEYQKRLAGMMALGALGEKGGAAPHADRVAAALMSHDADDAYRAASLSTLAELGAAAAGRHVASIAIYLDDGCLEVRAGAVHAMRILGSKASPYLSEIIELLADEEAEVSDLASDALHKLHTFLAPGGDDTPSLTPGA